MTHFKADKGMRKKVSKCQLIQKVGENKTILNQNQNNDVDFIFKKNDLLLNKM